MMNSQKLQDWLASLAGQRTPTLAYAKPQTILRLVPFFRCGRTCQRPHAALTLRTGEVLVSDDTVHLGASPENRTRGIKAPCVADVTCFLSNGTTLPIS